MPKTTAILRPRSALVYRQSYEWFSVAVPNRLTLTGLGLVFGPWAHNSGDDSTCIIAALNHSFPVHWENYININGNFVWVTCYTLTITRIFCRCKGTLLSNWENHINRTIKGNNKKDCKLWVQIDDPFIHSNPLFHIQIPNFKITLIGRPNIYVSHSNAKNALEETLRETQQHWDTSPTVVLFMRCYVTVIHYPDSNYLVRQIWKKWLHPTE